MRWPPCAPTPACATDLHLVIGWKRPVSTLTDVEKNGYTRAFVRPLEAKEVVGNQISNLTVPETGFDLLRKQAMRQNIPARPNYNAAQCRLNKLRHQETRLPRLYAPILVFVLLLGLGAYLTSTLFPPDYHKAKAIVMACVGLAAAVIYSVLAFRAGVFKRPKS
jgi:hypothetical protein